MSTATAYPTRIPQLTRSYWCEKGWLWTAAFFGAVAALLALVITILATKGCSACTWVALRNGLLVGSLAAVGGGLLSWLLCAKERQAPAITSF